MSGAPSDPAGAAEALEDLPKELWLELARVFRRAIEPLEDAELPASLRPYRGWKPDRLLASRPRRAVAEALARDARLRERLGEALGGSTADGDREQAPLARLIGELGEGRAAVQLVAAGRWDDLATLGAQVGARHAARARAAAERQRPPEPQAEREQRLESELAETRRARDRERAARSRAEERVRAVSGERDDLAGRVEALSGQVRDLEASLRAERARHRDRLERVRKRAADAEARARVDPEGVRKATDQLAEVAATLRTALGGEPEPAPADEERGEPAARAAPEPLPGTSRRAQPGRPCRLPPGLTHAEAAGVRALLGVPGIVVIVDGYNVTKDPKGVGAAALPDQRRWLVRLVAGVAGRYPARGIVVFDSAAEPEPGETSPRGVVVDFATDDETADDRIVGLVEHLDEAQPVVVVTSDRELARRCDALAADVVPARAFLDAAS